MSYFIATCTPPYHETYSLCLCLSVPHETVNCMKKDPQLCHCNQFTQAVIMRQHRLGGLNNRILFHHVLRLEVQDQGVCRFHFFSGLSLWIVDGRLLVASLAFLLSYLFLVFILVSKFPLLKSTSVIGLGPTFITSFYFIYLFEHPISKFSPHSEILGVKISIYEF